MKWHQKNRNFIIEIIIMMFVILFVYAEMSKLLEGNEFYTNLNNSPLFGLHHFAEITSWNVPIIEIFVAVLLAFLKTRLKGLYETLILMGIFTLYLAGRLFINPYRLCSCGSITLLSWKDHLPFNIIWICTALIAIVLHNKTPQIISS